MFRSLLCSHVLLTPVMRPQCTIYTQMQPLKTHYSCSNSIQTNPIRRRKRVRKKEETLASLQRVKRIKLCYCLIAFLMVLDFSSLLQRDSQFSASFSTIRIHTSANQLTLIASCAVHLHLHLCMFRAYEMCLFMSNLYS